MSHAKQDNNNLETAFSALGGCLVQVLLLVGLGLWLVSVWLTKLLVEHILDPVSNLAFSRNDGLLIIFSTLLWGSIIPLILFPLVLENLSDASPEETRRILVGTVLLGVAWGVSVGVKVVVDLWLEISNQLESVYDPTQMLGGPVRLGTISSGEQSARQPLPEKKDLEAELEEIFGNGTGKVI